MTDEEIIATMNNAQTVVDGLEKNIKRLREDNRELRNHIEGLIHLSQTAISELTDKQAALLGSMSNAIKTTADGMVKLSFSYGEGKFFRFSASQSSISQDRHVFKTYELGLLLLEREVDRGRVVTPEDNPTNKEEPKPEGWT